jgi:ERCC4-type nuclease
MSASSTNACCCSSSELIETIIEKSRQRNIHFQQATTNTTPAQAFVVLSIPSNCSANHHVLDLADGLGRVQTLRADVNAVHDGVAAEQAVRILEIIETLVGGLVARIGDEAVSASRPAGPTNLSGFHQNDGQEVEQQAHRMHS